MVLMLVMMMMLVITMTSLLLRTLGLVADDGDEHFLVGGGGVAAGPRAVGRHHYGRHEAVGPALGHDHLGVGARLTQAVLGERLAAEDAERAAAAVGPRLELGEVVRELERRFRQVRTFGVVVVHVVQRRHHAVGHRSTGTRFRSTNMEYNGTKLTFSHFAILIETTSIYNNSYDKREIERERER